MLLLFLMIYFSPYEKILHAFVLPHDPVPPVDGNISLPIDLRHGHDLLWPMGCEWG